MKPFVPAYVPVEESERVVRDTLADFAARPDWYASIGVTSAEELERSIRAQASEGELVGNGDYTVTIYRDVALVAGWPRLDWLSIKRNDRAPIHDWRELQAIKTALFSAQHEAVELYPAEDRVVDTANQYHLFVLAASEDGRPMRWPFGFARGLRTDRMLTKSKQRPGSGAEDLDA